MFKDVFFKPDPSREDARAILAGVVQAARRQDFYGPGRTPDTFDGRFQLLALFGALVLRRLRTEPAVERLAQEFSDQLFRSFDDGLREAGVGDISVPKHMKKMARAFYGRLTAYDQALTEGGAEALSAALSRNIWDAEAAPYAPTLAVAAMAQAQRLAETPVAQLATPALWEV